MPSGKPRCSRCGSVFETRFRFCPNCGLPTAGDDVLSTEIGSRREAEERGRRLRDGGSRALFIAGLATMLAFVGGLGFVLFDPDLLETIVQSGGAHEVPQRIPRDWVPVWQPIRAGTFVSGPPADAASPESEERVQVTFDAPFQMSKYEVPNRLWALFLNERRRQFEQNGLLSVAVPGPLCGWVTDPSGEPRPAQEEADRPVRNVSPLVAALFCEWLTDRIGDPEWTVRLPTRLEWEYAARGPEARLYPWGNEFLVPPAPGTGASRPRERKNLHGLSSVQDVDEDESYFHVIGMGTNVEEFVVSAAPNGTERQSKLIEDRVVYVTRAGASFNSQQPEVQALAYRTGQLDTEPLARWSTVGIRLVRVRTSRNGTR